MKKIILPLLLVMLLAGCKVEKANETSGAGGGQGTENAAGGSGGSDAFSGTLKAAVKLGVPMKCSYKVNGAEYEGYLKGEQWRGKMTNPQGQVGEVLMKDNCMYSWSDAQPQGVKMCFEADQSWYDQGDSGVRADMDYNCRPSTVGDDKFTVPANIEFMDMQSMMGAFE